MYRLLCISGDETGKTYLLKSGETLLGRLDADIIVNSPGVSKKHAKILIQEDKVLIKDLESKNGTFVNGVMIREKKLKPGDKIGIYNNVFQFENINVSEGIDGIGGFKLDEDFDFEAKEKYKPSGLVASINNFLDTAILPFFESLIKRYPITFILPVIIIALTSAVTIIVTVPIISYDGYLLEKEASLRGIYLSNLLATENRDLIDVRSNKEPSVVSVSGVPGVKMAFVIDVEGRVLAPTEYEGQMIPATILARTQKIISGEIKVEDIEAGDIAKMEGGADIYKIAEGEYWVTSPIRIYSSEEGKKVIAGFSVINFTSSANALSFSSASQRIVIGMVIAGFIGLILAILLGRLFNIPFVRLYDEVDLTVKGDSKKITYQIASKYAKDLIDLLNIVLKRTKRFSAKDSSIEDIDMFAKGKRKEVDEIEIINSIGNSLKTPFFVIDTSNIIVTANRAFNEIASFKAMDWNGVSLIDSIQDQNLLGAILNLTNKYKEIRQDISDEIFVNDKALRVTVNGIKDNKGSINYYCVSVEN